MYTCEIKSLVPKSRRYSHLPMRTGCITIVLSFLLSPSPPLPIFFNSHFSSPVKLLRIMEDIEVRVEGYRGDMKRPPLSTDSNSSLDERRVDGARG